jgi:heterodisulfide reductase subunit B2
MSTKQAKYQKVAYYPGCALEGTAHSYNRSTQQVGKALGLDLVEVKNWNCCGAMEVKNVDPKLQTYLSSRVMAIAASEMKMDVVMAPATRRTSPARSRRSTRSTGSSLGWVRKA